MLDLFPTVCDVLGIHPGDVDGQSLMPLLTGSGSAGAHRDKVFSVFHETAMKSRFEMRCVQDARWGYIWNAWSDGKTTYRAENMMGLSWAAMTAAAKADPHALRNLAESREHAGERDAARHALSEWMSTVGDPLGDRFTTEVVNR